MLAYKKLVRASIYVYMFALFVGLVDAFKQINIDQDPFLRKQIESIKEGVIAPRVMIYGSSGVLLGLSAHDLSLYLGLEVVNLSTFGQGERFSQIISLLKSGPGIGRVLVLSDRDYRSSDLKSSVEVSIVRDYFSRVPLVPNLRRILRTGNGGDRGERGDFLNYENMPFSIDLNQRSPRYSTAGFELIKLHIDSLKTGGICPIIAFVPILTTSSLAKEHEDQTFKMIRDLTADGYGQYVVNIPMIETDQSLFMDNAHMSAAGRAKWTKLLASEIKARKMCGIDAKI